MKAMKESQYFIQKQKNIIGGTALAQIRHTRDFIVGYLTEYCNQDNLATAFPTYWQVKDIEDDRPVYKGFFLTTKDAEKHLENYRYRYSSKASIFMWHMRNDCEMHDFIAALLIFFDIGIIGDKNGKTDHSQD